MRYSTFFQLRLPTLSIDRIFQKGVDFKVLFIEEQEAIYVASCSLFEELKNNNENIVVAKSCYKYLTRMASRSTPYGLFSGVLLGTVAENSSVILKGHRSFAELDIVCCQQLSSYLLKKEFIREKVKFYTNNTLYEVGSNYRYYEYELVQNKRKYSITAVENDGFLSNILEKTKQGIYLPELRILLQEHFSEEDSQEFSEELITSQLLIAELEPSVSDIPFLSKAISLLEPIQEAVIIKNILQKIQVLLEVQEDRIKAFGEIKELLSVHFEIVFHKDFLYVNKHYKAVESQLSEKVIKTIQNNLQSLKPLFIKAPKSNLETFKNAFYARYEEEEMPLSLVLDNEFGIGYGDKMLVGEQGMIGDLIFEDSKNQKLDKEWSKWEMFLLKKYTKALRDKKQEITLTKSDFADLDNTVEFSSSFYVLGSILGKSCEDLDKGNFQFQLNSIGGSSAINLMTRFSASDNELYNNLQFLAEQEIQNSNEILADIIYLPEERVGNVVRHPSLRAYEIPILSLSSLLKENQIPIDDLMVSVPQGKRVVLRSKKLNKVVIPRLSNAHNYQVGLPIYCFLCDIQDQESYYFQWNWSVFLDEPFLPKVTYENIILCKSTWNLVQKDLDKLEQFQATFLMPNLVQLVDGDNALLLDLNLAICQEILKDEIAKKGKARLTEFLQTPENCWIMNDLGQYFASEIVIPFESSKPFLQENIAKYPNFNRKELNPNFSMGSQWLYVKIYIGEKSAEKLLRENIVQLIEQLKEENQIEKWFFVRYDDGEPHIRLRFYHSQNMFFYRDVLEKLNVIIQPYLLNGTIHRLQLDTYKPEYTRYENDMVKAESIFCADSEAVLALLPIIQTGEERVFATLLGINTYLNDFCFSIQEKANFTEMVRNAFLKEHGSKKIIKKNLDTKYRNLQNTIDTVFSDDYMLEIKKIFQHRSSKIELATKKISQEVLQSYIHLFINRLFISEQRTYELLTYHLLYKYYRSILARMK